MTFKYLPKKITNNLIKDIYYLSFSKKIIPFETLILPSGLLSITFNYNNYREVTFKSEKMILKGLFITGQFNRSYNYKVVNTGESLGISLHPTTLYKILKTDISKLTNKHVSLKNFSLFLYNHLAPIFTSTETSTREKGYILEQKIEELTNNFIDKDVVYIDKIIDLIIKKEGLLDVNEILTIIPFSQKSLETKFKKIVGITPGKYLKLYRFIALMKKYNNQSIKINDLVYMYDYYDYSHFSKDFKLFMNQSPKSYFKNESEFITTYLNKIDNKFL